MPYDIRAKYEGHGKAFDQVIERGRAYLMTLDGMEDECEEDWKGGIE